jgi:hypothetical protein
MSRKIEWMVGDGNGRVHSRHYNLEAAERSLERSIKQFFRANSRYSMHGLQVLPARLRHDWSYTANRWAWLEEDGSVYSPTAYDEDGE